MSEKLFVFVICYLYHERILLNLNLLDSESDCISFADFAGAFPKFVVWVVNQHGKDVFSKKYKLPQMAQILTEAELI